MLARLVLISAAVALSGIASTAHAATERDRRAFSAARGVEIVVIGGEGELESLRSTIGPNAFGGAEVRWVGATHLELGEVLERRPDTGNVDVRAFVDLSDENSASLYFADRRGERFLVRAISLPDGLSPLGREALGQVLELSVLALLKDDPIGMTRDETAELLKVRTGSTQPKAEPAQDRPGPKIVSHEDGTSSLAAEVFYGARLFSGDVPIVHGPGLALAWLTAHRGDRSFVWVGGQYELREELVTPAVSVEWTTLRLQTGGGLSYSVTGSSVLLGGRLGAGVDFTSFTPRRGTSGGSLRLEPARSAAAPVVSAAFEATLPVHERLSVSLQAFASVHLVRVHFELARDDERSRVLVPYWVRPGLALGVLLR